MPAVSTCFLQSTIFEFELQHREKERAAQAAGLALLYLEVLDQFLDLPVLGGEVGVALGPALWLLLVLLAL